MRSGSALTVPAIGELLAAHPQPVADGEAQPGEQLGGGERRVGGEQLGRGGGRGRS